MTDAWTIFAGGRVYGPYTLERMRGFAEEGRLAPHSLVSREGSPDCREAREDGALAGLFDADSTQTVAPPASAPAAKSQLTIAANVKPKAKARLEEAILSLGPAYKLLSNVWILSSEQTASAVRNRLARELGRVDTLFVVDSTHGKAAWCNFGPHADTRIRRVWQKSL